MTGWRDQRDQTSVPARFGPRSGDAISASVEGSARRRSRFRSSRPVLAILIPVLAVGLAACAPEPGQGNDPGTSPGSGEGTGSGSGGDTSDQDDPGLKAHELPAGFPSDNFAIPEDAVIDDAGERGPGSWYVVLRADDAPQADDWWTQIAGSSGFEVRGEEPSDDGGRSAKLISPNLSVLALTIPQADGSVLLSYDLGPVVS